MRLITFAVVAVILLAQNISAQSVPLGMKYQAVARDMQGQVIPDRDLRIKITLYSEPGRPEIAYEEIQQVRTNAFGLFAISIGEGEPNSGVFESVPWSSRDIWMEVGIQTEEDSKFVTISDSKMLSVPYAFHAATAGQLIEQGGGRSGDPTQIYTKIWNLQSNYLTDPERDKLGTGDMADLVIVTNSIERLRVLADGDIEIQNSVEINRDLEVGKNVYLNSDTIVDPQNANFEESETYIFGKLNVKREKPTHLTGTLRVDGITEITNPTQSDTTTDGALVVTGGVGIGKNLNVGGDFNLGGMASFSGMISITDTTQSTSTSTGALKVAGGVGIGRRLNVGERVHFEDALEVDGITTISSTVPSTSDTDGALVVDGGVGIQGKVNIGDELSVKGSNSSYLAHIDNSDGVTGDGLRIKLGRTHPRWDDAAQPPFSNEVSAQLPGFTFWSAAVMSVKNLIKGLMVSPETTFSVENFESIGADLASGLEAELGADLDTYASAACNLTKSLIEELNAEIPLPLDLPQLTIPKITLSDDVTILGIPIPGIDFPATNIPGTGVQLIPAIPVPSCPPPPMTSDWSLPNFRLDTVNNSLNHGNVYVQFVDKYDRQVGAIRGESITEWCDRYLSLTYFLNIFNSFAGVTVIGLDPTQIAETLAKYGINGLAQITNLADAYNSIGVEYQSGFADYAEWLERVNQNEVISPGDIVGVKGGKITRDLQGAEQVMAVSSNPMIVGNAPPQGQEYTGNNIAFMGQVPVKIMGPVTSGDFIIGSSDIPGYGVAVHPADMTAEDVQMAVGRSWETISAPGPKLVNTVIGVHNGAFIHVMKKYESRLDETDKRLSSIEEQISSLLPLASGN